MDDINALIEKFWRGQTSRQEMKYLLLWLDQHGKEWKGILKKEFSIDQPLPSDVELTDDRALEIWSKISRSTVKKPIKLSPILLVASFILLGVCAVYLLFNSYSKKKLSYQEVKISIVQKINQTKFPKEFVLPEQTRVTLSSGSSIQYTTRFGQKDRQLQLKGKGHFRVAKHTDLPFKVSSGGILTTALGTEFIVKEDGNGRVSVELIAGKVVVTAVPGSSIKMAPVFPLPGQELWIDTRLSKARLTAAHPSSLSSGKPHQFRDNMGLTKPLYFNKTPLDQVFSTLSTRFHQSILYDKASLKSIVFTGFFAPDDHLLPWLKAVCQMNGFNCRKKNDKIEIFKIHPD